MKKPFCFTALLGLLVAGPALVQAQAPTNPAITGWLRNTTGIRGRHYATGSSAPVADTAHANVQKVRYSAGNAYVNCSGVPAYITGPFGNNPAYASNRNYLFKLPLAPVANPGTATATGLGNIGIFINGVVMYNFADAMSYQNQGIWHQNAVVFENDGFDCAKGHPSPVGRPIPGTLVAGSYHHHQNPAAFNLATAPPSTVCTTYLSDGLYVPDSTQHGPLLGFAFDGFPVYGGYGYANPQQLGAIKRLTPSYRQRAITARTSLANGTQLPPSQYGPSLAAAALGSYGEDHEYVAGLGDLDLHNGRLGVTPEYPQGTYAYFATIDRNGNSQYPYLLGPTYYGVVEASNFPPMGPPQPGLPPTQVVVNEPVTVYTGTPTGVALLAPATVVSVFPNPANGVLLVQVGLVGTAARTVELLDLTGRVVARQTLVPGTTLCRFETQRLRAGTYVVRVSGVAGKGLKVVLTD